MADIKLIDGLGNPGRQYEKTRHNAGFLFLDILAQDFHADFSQNSKMLGLLAKIEQPGVGSVWLLKPSTFMNRSGQSVGALARFYQLQPEQVLVVHDELDFGAGTVKLKKGGGHGGHNGLRDIIAHLQSRDFYRLRLGIGHPGSREQVIQYVLERSSAADQRSLEDAINQAMVVMPELLKGNLEAATKHLHSV